MGHYIYPAPKLLNSVSLQNEAVSLQSEGGSSALILLLCLA